MNKKRLSVVMAGAMLASSVAPVLAAEVQKSEMSASEKGLLVDEISRKVQESPVFANISDTDKVETDVKGKSVYAIQVGDTIKYLTKGATLKETQDDVSTKLGTLTVGTVVKLVNLGYVESKDGSKEILSMQESATFTEDELKGKGNGTVYKTLYGLETDPGTDTGFASIVKDYEYVEGTGFVITFQDAVKFYAGKKLVLTTDSTRLNFTKYYNTSDRNASDSIADADIAANFFGFENADPENVSIPNKVEKEYTITSDAAAYELKDLYDGVMLTEKGQDLLSLAKDARDAAKAKNLGVSEELSKTAAVTALDLNTTGTDITSNTKAGNKITTSLVKDEKGLYRVSVSMLNPFRANSGAATEFDTFTITSDNEASLKLVLSWLDGAHARVDELSGEDRYETAVKIAKEVAEINKVEDSENIVLVNGDSLVDGLAAAPLAHKLTDGGTKNAPILLTEKNSLPKATKTYLNELVDNATNNTVTVHIVGGTGVVSDSVKRELKAMNLKVERYAGEDRQETSLAVAEKINEGTAYTEAFVVGATGEADAMSVAGYAASVDAPIIVSGFEGLSEEALEAVESKTVHVIGGDAAVSKSNFETIKDVATKVRRISGEDRKATNAEVINTFYTGTLGNGTDVDDSVNAKSVIVAKDDVLVDALTASNLSAFQNAPIVLATKELSKEQLNAVVKNAKYAKDIYQVGGNVAREVVKTIAQSLGLA